MSIFGLLLEEIQGLFQIFNIVRYPLWRALYHDISVYAISPVILINAPQSESPVKALHQANTSYHNTYIAVQLLHYKQHIYGKNCPIKIIFTHLESSWWK